MIFVYESFLNYLKSITDPKSADDSRFKVDMNEVEGSLGKIAETMTKIFSKIARRVLPIDIVILRKTEFCQKPLTSV